MMNILSLFISIKDLFTIYTSFVCLSSPFFLKKINKKAGSYKFTFPASVYNIHFQLFKNRNAMQV